MLSREQASRIEYCFILTFIPFTLVRRAHVIAHLMILSAHPPHPPVASPLFPIPQHRIAHPSPPTSTHISLLSKPHPPPILKHVPRVVHFRLPLHPPASISRSSDPDARFSPPRYRVPGYFHFFCGYHTLHPGFPSAV